MYLTDRRSPNMWNPFQSSKVFLGSGLLLFVCLGGGLLWTYPMTTIVVRTQLHILFTANRSHFTTGEMLYFTTGRRDSAKNRLRLLEYIRTQIKPPSKTKRNVTAATPGFDYSQIGLSTYVDSLLGARRGGFFVEYGAYRGENVSNTLRFELERNWTGILIQPNDPNAYETFTKQKRNAHYLPGCLSSTVTPRTVSFFVHPPSGGTVSRMPPGDKTPDVKINQTLTAQCYPFNSVVKALNVSRVDYLSLDAKLGGIAVLHTIDFVKTRIDVVSVEYAVANKTMGTLRNHDALLKFFQKLRERSARYYETMAFLPAGSDSATARDMVFRLKV